MLALTETVFVLQRHVCDEHRVSAHCGSGRHQDPGAAGGVVPHDLPPCPQPGVCHGGQVDLPPALLRLQSP